MNELYTIGFTKKSLEEFIDLLKENGISKVVDIRLNNSSQLSGFSKSKDLIFVLNLFNILYEHVKNLTPEKEMLKEYRKSNNWDEYEKKFMSLMNKRDAKSILKKLIQNQKICLLCSEDKPDKCHRRLVAELLEQDGVKIINL